MRKSSVVFGAFIAAVVVSVSSALPADAATVASTVGPFSEITTGSDLNCSAELAGVVEDPIFRPSASCATLVAAGGTLNLPSDENLSWSFENARTWVPVSQSNTGDGTIFDPFVITTVAAGESIELTQTDTYVSSESSYSTKISIRNTGASSLSPVVYRVINCTEGEPWEHVAYAEVAADGEAPVCRGAEGAAIGPWGEGMVPGDAILQLIPNTPEGAFALGKRRDVLPGIDGQLHFGPGARSSGQPIENLMAVSWQLHLEAGASSEVAFQTHYSAEGERAVPVSLASGERGDGEVTVTASFGTADAPVAISGGARVTLPAGASYVKGSSTIGEPMVIGDVLMFTAPVSSTDTSFTFRVAGGETAVSGELALVGTTMGGVDFVQATTPIEIPLGSPKSTATPTSMPTATPTPAQTVTATPTATAPSIAPVPPVSTASASSTATPEVGVLATTGSEGNLAPLGIGAGAAVVVGALLAALAVRRRLLG